MTDNQSHLEDGGGPVVIAVEEAGLPGALYVRVGPVFDGNEQRSAPGVWIEYQDQYKSGDVLGPLLISPATWYQLTRAVDRRLQRRGKFGWPRRWTRLDCCDEGRRME